MLATYLEDLGIETKVFHTNSGNGTGMGNKQNQPDRY